MHVDDRALEWSGVAGVGAAGFFNAFAPNLREIRQACRTEEGLGAMRADLRASYVPAGLLSAALAGGASLAARSLVPALITAGAVGLMVLSYERALPLHARLRITPRMRHMELYDMLVSANE